MYNSKRMNEKFMEAIERDHRQAYLERLRVLMSRVGQRPNLLREDFLELLDLIIKEDIRRS